jgi:hypothetical protein
MKENSNSPFSGLFPDGLNPRLDAFVQAVKREDSQYAADELVELAEEILNQIAAAGIAYYLQSKHQKEVFNDSLIQLFNSSGHDYNAGRIYRWAANMIKHLEDEMPAEHYQFFWKNGQLNNDVQHLALLRNEVMHGFFVLPPERNIKEATAIGALLKELKKCSMLNSKVEYHFLSKEGFTGNWNVTHPHQWQNLLGSHSFGQLCERVIHENTDEFWQKENEIFTEISVPIPAPIKAFVLNNSKGAMAVWVHPHDTISLNLYASLGTWLKQENITFVGYQLHNQGLSYAGSFLLNRLIQVLKSKTDSISKNKKLEAIVQQLRREDMSKKVVVLLHQIHLALFSPQHVSKLNNFLYENDILLIAVGHHYEHFNSLFNSSITMDYAKETPSNEETLIALHNYLRFKGPSKDRPDEMAEVVLLEQILEKVLSDLSSGHSIYARRFADDHGYDIEYVHEIFALLHPWVNTRRESFEQDTVDELYGFPSTMTEVTPIYLALGRRDLKLEYQHKVISL